tara:strand:- start:31434 stop:33176 length:1743 start_codon:yes stop_codon:yes gene_type:complete
MIKEFALSLSNRHHFHESNKMSQLEGTPQDTFMSLWDYDNYVIEYFNKNNKLAGFDGLIYMPDELILDVDGKNLEQAKHKTLILIELLYRKQVPYQIYFSGRGFHVNIPSSAFKWEPCKDLHLKVKDKLKAIGVYKYADPSVIDKTRIIRVPNTLNTKSGKWKIPLNETEFRKFNLNFKNVPRRDFKYPEMKCDPVFDVLDRITKTPKETEVVKSELGRDPDPTNYTCIQLMLKGVSQGSRHMTALRLGSHLRWRYPESVVRLIMEDWRQRVDKHDVPFTEEELDKIITSCYTANDGSGYNYGCSDSIKDSLCQQTCFLYKSKKDQSVMSATDMENVLIDFYTSNVKPINFNELYEQVVSFPIYPGEVVLLQAPPKSMKTMLLMNWINAFKKNTYMMELEMSPRQMMSRFIMIERGWDEEDLKIHYSRNRNGIDVDFNWLQVDYHSCYPYEIEKRIQMLPEKPEILVVDHLGLLRSRMKDNNMKVEEASQVLTEIAVQYDLIVFVISEITKSAFHEGMNIASSKGSFRVAYNVNKVLSLEPLFDIKEKSLIKGLKLESTANREKETLHVDLSLDGLRLVG